MNRDWETYGRTEYSVTASLRSRADRHIVVFRVDTKLGQESTRTIYLDRAETPIDQKVWDEWASVINTVLTNGAEHRYGIQVSLLDEIGG